MHETIGSLGDVGMRGAWVHHQFVPLSSVPVKSSRFIESDVPDESAASIPGRHQDWMGVLYTPRSTRGGRGWPSSRSHCLGTFAGSAKAGRRSGVEADEAARAAGTRGVRAALAPVDAAVNNRRLCDIERLVRKN